MIMTALTSTTVMAMTPISVELASGKVRVEQQDPRVITTFYNVDGSAREDQSWPQQRNSYTYDLQSIQVKSTYEDDMKYSIGRDTIYNRDVVGGIPLIYTQQATTSTTGSVSGTLSGKAEINMFVKKIEAELGVTVTGSHTVSKGKTITLNNFVVPHKKKADIRAYNGAYGIGCRTMFKEYKNGVFNGYVTEDNVRAWATDKNWYTLDPRILSI